MLVSSPLINLSLNMIDICSQIKFLYIYIIRCVSLKVEKCFTKFELNSFRGINMPQRPYWRTIQWAIKDSRDFKRVPRYFSTQHQEILTYLYKDALIGGNVKARRIAYTKKGRVPDGAFHILSHLVAFCKIKNANQLSP